MRYHKTVLAARRLSASGQFRPVRLVLATLAHRPCFESCFFVTVSTELMFRVDLGNGVFDA